MKRPALWLGLLAALLAGPALTSFGRVEKNEEGVLLRFGRSVRVLPPGIHPKLPWPVDRILRVATTQVRTVSIGAGSELLADSGERPEDSSEAASAGPVGPQPGAGQWITGDTNIIALELAVQYTVSDVRDYLFAVDRGPHADSADPLVRTVAEAAVTALVARRGIDELLAAGKAELQLSARREIQAGLDALSSGIALAGVTITSAAPPAQVITAFNDVTSAASDSERDLDRADGYRLDLLPTERARANRIEREAQQEEDAVTNEARGRAQAFLALLAELESSPSSSVSARRRIWLESVTRLLGRVRTKVYPAGQPFKLNLVE